MNFVPAINYKQLLSPRALSAGALAGLAGGCAEVAWIVLYAGLSGAEAAGVARGVTGSLFPALAAASAAVPLGIAIHMLLAILLGVAISILLRSAFPRLSNTLFEPVAVTGLLIGVWAINFFIILPALNPAFVSIVPYAASLTSKVLFGVAAAFVLKALNGSRTTSGGSD